MPIARSGTVDLHYDVRGSGQPILLIMGYRSSSHMWLPAFVDPLSRNFQVITFDNRGTGLSSKPNSAYTIATMADDAAKVLDQLAVEQAHVFGVSMGGMIAQELALRHPSRVNRLILGCTTCNGRQAALEALPAYSQLLTSTNLSLEQGTRRRWHIMLGREFVNNRPDVIDNLTHLTLAYPTPAYTAMRQALAIQEFDTTSRIRLIKRPALVVTGSADILIPVAHSYLLADRISGCELEVLQGAGHGFFWEQPDYLAGLIAAFCG